MFVGLGGNTPGTLDAFRRSALVLERLLDDFKPSSLYRSDPWGDLDQEPFWNAAAVGLWSGSADSFLERLLMLESREGRQRDPLRPKGPRILDLDLLQFGPEVRDTPRLALPHPRLSERRFALEPLVELAADALDPRGGRPWGLILRALPPAGVDRVQRTW